MVMGANVNVSSEGKKGSTGVTQGEVIGLLSDILANLVLSSDNTKHASWGLAVNQHRSTVRTLARRLSLRSDSEFNDAFPAIWQRVCSEGEAKCRATCEALVKASPWNLVLRKVKR